MKFKLVQSEADGLFQKANRKHQILLTFELKRIAVEQKMRERYFSFEKSLVEAHREKIVRRQKALGIYNSQKTSEKRPFNSFFLTKVPMDTKQRSKLPPVRELQRQSGHKEFQHIVVKSATQNSVTNKNRVNSSSFPDLDTRCSLTELPKTDGSIWSSNNEAAKKEICNDPVNGETSNTKQTNTVIESKHDTKHRQMNDLQNHINRPYTVLALKKGLQSERADGKRSSDKPPVQTHSNSSEVHSGPKNTTVQNSSPTTHSDLTVLPKFSKERRERSLSIEQDLLGKQRPKSVNSRSVEGVRNDLNYLSLRAQSAGTRRTRSIPIPISQS